MSVIVQQFQTVRFIQMMSLTFGLFTQVSGSGPLGPLVFFVSHTRHFNISNELHFQKEKGSLRKQQRYKAPDCQMIINR